MTWQALEELRQQRAAAMAYFDNFWLFAVLAILLVVPRAADESLCG
jgi:hypothetical protein